MRLGIILSTVGVLLFPLTSSSALNSHSQAAHYTITGSSGGGGLTVVISGSNHGSSGGTTRQSGSSSGRSYVIIYVPYLTFHSGRFLSRVCVAYRTVTMQSGEAANLERAYAASLWSRLLQSRERCQPLVVAVSPPIIIRPSAPSIAEELWSERYSHLLPAPGFSIPPGYGVVNIPSYVVTQGAPIVDYSNFTPLGNLTIAARGTYYVSQDGGQYFQGPFAGGDAWPIGGISLSWTRPSSANIVLKEVWTATWYLDGSSGAFLPVSTVSSLYGFKVQSLSALSTN